MAYPFCGGHLRAERLVERLVRRQPLRLDARGPEDEVRERVVGDQRGHLARGDQLAHVLRLGLRERARAAVGLVRRVRRRARAAPEPAVVAVRVDAGAGQAERRLQARARLGVGDQPAVLAPVLVRVREDVDRLVVGAAATAVAAALQLAGLARGVEAIGVDDRDDDRARALHQPLRPRVAVAIAEDQLVGPLHRVLGRRPLPRVVSAHLQEHGLAVGGAGVGCDLDALDGTALVGAVVERDRPHEVGVLAGQALEVLAVVEQPPVGVLPAGELGLGVGGRESGVGRAVVPALGGEIGHRRRPLEARLAERGGVGGAVQDDAQVAGAAVLGHVEAEVGELLRALARGRRDPHQRRGGGGGRRGDRRHVDVETGAADAARDAAGLHGERARAGDEALGDLDAAAVARAGHQSAADGVEDRDVPVAGAAVEARGHASEAGGRDGALDVSGPRREQLRRAVPLHRDGRADRRRLRGASEKRAACDAERQRPDPLSDHARCLQKFVARPSRYPASTTFTPETGALRATADVRPRRRAPRWRAPDRARPRAQGAARRRRGRRRRSPRAPARTGRRPRPARPRRRG